MTAINLPIEPNSDADMNDLSASASRLDKSFAEIDWQAPWLCHLSQLRYLSQSISQFSAVKADDLQAHKIENTPDTIAKVLNTAMAKISHSQVPFLTKPTASNNAQTLKFVSQNALPEGEAYESFIGTTGNIPTRDNLHDLFNGSIWLTFPQTKALLNYHHMCEIAEQGINEGRGRVRDTITVFDENGAVLVTSNSSIGEALVDFDWKNSLVRPRAEWDNPQQLNDDSQAAVYIFGHALLEQLVQPRKPLCAHSVVIHVPQTFFALSLSERLAYLDHQLAQYMNTLLSNNNVTPRLLAPLPILGVPHFWAKNIHTDFYEDGYVFRSGRRQKGKV